MYNGFNCYCSCSVISIPPWKVKTTDSSALFGFNGFKLSFQLFISCGVALIAFKLFCLVLYLEGVFIHASADEFCRYFHLLKDGLCLGFRFRLIAEGGLYKSAIINHGFMDIHPFAEGFEEPFCLCEE